MKLNKEEIFSYWNNRAEIDSSMTSTTNDIWMRKIEQGYVKGLIGELRPQSVLDSGCGDGITTLDCAKIFTEIKFQGEDFSNNMIKNAKSNLKKQNPKLNNIQFKVNNILDLDYRNSFDLCYTTRCIINLHTWQDQKRALHRLQSALIPGGYLLLIENFEHSQKKFNKIRNSFGLPSIKIRDHNKFLKQKPFKSFMADYFRLIKCQNISSLYYLMSRVVYSKICQETSTLPDYDDIHHRLASALPFCGDFGPTKAFLYQKL